MIRRKVKRERLERWMVDGCGIGGTGRLEGGKCSEEGTVRGRDGGWMVVGEAEQEGGKKER